MQLTVLYCWQRVRRLCRCHSQPLSAWCVFSKVRFTQYFSFTTNQATRSMCHNSNNRTQRLDNMHKQSLYENYCYVIRMGPSEHFKWNHRKMWLFKVLHDLYLYIKVWAVWLSIRLCRPDSITVTVELQMKPQYVVTYTYRRSLHLLWGPTTTVK